MSATVCEEPTRRIESWTDFQAAIAGVQAHWPNEDRCLFRGQSDHSWDLRPTLARALHGNDVRWNDVWRIEREMANQFRQESHRVLPQAVLSAKDYLLDWWPLMGHYGAPTRLLDWTLSPYVALYFAVERHWTCDGALWWFRGSALNNLMVRQFGARYSDQAKQLFGAHDSTVFYAPPEPLLFHFELRRTTDRIGNQQGFFTMSLDPFADHVEILSGLSGYGDGPHIEKLIIPSKCKPLFMRELQLMNVTGKTMFPGLDGLGRTLAELTKLSITYGVP